MLVGQEGRIRSRCTSLACKADRIAISGNMVGDLKWQSFWFRGPKNKHNLIAPNLSLFCHIGRGLMKNLALPSPGDYCAE